MRPRVEAKGVVSPPLFPEIGGGYVSALEAAKVTTSILPTSPQSDDSGTASFCLGCLTGSVKRVPGKGNGILRDER